MIFIRRIVLILIKILVKGRYVLLHDILLIYNILIISFYYLSLFPKTSPINPKKLSKNIYKY